MNKYLLNVARNILPKSIRTSLGMKYCQYQWKKSDTVQKIREYYRNTNDKEILEILPSLDKYIGMIPYPYSNIPLHIPVKVYLDSEKNLKYVIMDDKKLYFPSEMDEYSIKYTYYWTYFVEQHPSSPHCYLPSNFRPSPKDIAVEFGSAEASWGLSIIENIKKLYVFEPEDKWIEPLKATFSKWLDKVVIVKKFISDSVDDNSTTMDYYFKDKEFPTLIKIDIEGFEKQALIGGKELLSEKHGIQAFICTYHKEEDYKELSNIMKEYGFTITHSDGYIFPTWDIKAPYFRRGLIRCIKA